MSPLPTSGDPAHPTSDDLAIMLGLKKGSSAFITRQWAHEGERTEDTAQLLIALNRFCLHSGNVVFSEFAARYLPATVDRFIEASFELPRPPAVLVTPPIFEIQNAYFVIIKRLRSSTYFVKYLRSKHPLASQGKKLGRILAERFAAMVQVHGDSILHPDYTETVNTILEFLVFILLLDNGQEPVPVNVRNILIPFCKDCQKSSHEDLRETSDSLSIFLVSGCPESAERNDLTKLVRGRDECKLPGCNITTNLKACARCLIVCYCSPEHQRIHWSIKTSPPHRLY
ncbi:hypothetical protein BDN72DRAFT_842863 [Pluteus cervinus]|uniref:Uncharacterized protein n=1 Tax=Pluteus cervinus TaxID=181527 RepID=A0ACD3APD8_9AGAR|nr:hypothetical protein BDN72DRAFT_842863 [Pluteus cervinus]